MTVQLAVVPQCLELPRRAHSTLGGPGHRLRHLPPAAGAGSAAHDGGHPRLSEAALAHRAWLHGTQRPPGAGPCRHGARDLWRGAKLRDLPCPRLLHHLPRECAGDSHDPGARSRPPVARDPGRPGGTGQPRPGRLPHDSREGRPGRAPRPARPATRRRAARPATSVRRSQWRPCMPPAPAAAREHRSSAAAPQCTWRTSAPSTRRWPAATSSRCQGCHARPQCLDCHRGTPERTPQYHPQTFLERHPAAAYARETNCSDCHNSGGILPELPCAGRPRQPSGGARGGVP